MSDENMTFEMQNILSVEWLKTLFLKFFFMSLNFTFRSPSHMTMSNLWSSQYSSVVEELNFLLKSLQQITCDSESHSSNAQSMRCCALCCVKHQINKITVLFMYSMVVVKKRSVNLKGENFSNLELPFYKVGGLVKDRFKKKKKNSYCHFFLSILCGEQHFQQ